MSVMEEFLELQEKVAKLEKIITQKENELSEKDSKILEITEKINSLTNDAMKNQSDTRVYKNMVSTLETDKKNLERERDRLVKENETLATQMKQFASMIETTNKTLQTKEEMLLSKEKQLATKDELLNQKDAKLEDYRTKFESMSEEKEKYQKEKFEFMEKINQEKLELVEKIGNLEKVHQADEASIKKFKDKSKTAQDGLLGATMEIETLNERISKLTQQLQEAQTELEKSKSATVVTEESEIDKYKKKITELEITIEQQAELKKTQEQKGESTGEEDIFAKGTGVYNSLSALIAHFKVKIPNAQRAIRLVVPELPDLNKHGFYEILKTLQAGILKNVACTVDSTRDGALSEELKSHNYKITDYRSEGNNAIFALTIDSTEAALAIFDKTTEAITGIYTNNEELVKLVSQAIMQPFIRGVKLN